MGKSKKRIFNKNVSTKGMVLKRDEVVLKILSDIKNNNLTSETKKYISLFGITMEELSDAGAEFEELSIAKNFIL